VSSDPVQIPFVDYGGEGELIHIAHANGFPPKTYNSLIENLTSDHRVIAMDLRPLWANSDHQNFKNWETAADDLIRFLDQQKHEGIIGVGHSFGGIITLIASVKRPKLFKKIVLIEPVVLPSWVYWMTKVLPKPILKKVNPIVKKTLVRTTKWPSREKAFEQFRAKKIFSKIADKELWDYVNAATVPTKNEGFELRFKREWEAQIYMTFSSQWKNIDSVSIPYLTLKGETSDTITPGVWKKWQGRKCHGKLIEIPEYGHLLPLEAPDKSAEIIRQFLRES
jgi:pimeloyl-ACP methyl ester carboxylesterase